MKKRTVCLIALMSAMTMALTGCSVGNSVDNSAEAQMWMEYHSAGRSEFLSSLPADPDGYVQRIFWRGFYEQGSYGNWKYLW